MASCAHELECAAGVSSRVHAGVHVVPPDSRAPPARRDINVHATGTSSVRPSSEADVVKRERLWPPLEQGRVVAEASSHVLGSSGGREAGGGAVRRR